MSDQQGTIEVIAQELTKLLQPLKDDLSPGRVRFLLAELGFAVSAPQIMALSVPLKNTADQVVALINKSKELAAAIEAADEVEILKVGIELIGIIKNVLDSFAGMRDGIGGLALPGITAPEISQIPEKLFNYLLVRYLDRLQGFSPVLAFLGILEQVEQNVGSLDPTKPPFTQTSFHFNRIGQWLGKPGEQFKALYKWGDNTFDGKALFAKLEDILSRQGIPVLYDETAIIPKLDLIVLDCVPKTDIDPKGLFFSLSHELNHDFVLSEKDFDLSFNLDFAPPIFTGIIVQPNGNLSFVPPDSSAPLSGKALFDLHVKKKDAPAPYVILGQTGGSRLEVLEFILRSGAELIWTAGHADGKFFIEGAVNQCKIIIDTSSGDGFLSKLLPGTKVNADFDLLLGVSSESGFYFSGSSALEIRLPLHIGLGPISIEGLTVALKFNDGKFPVELGADIKGTLGPLVVVVQNMGVKATFSFPPNNSGNLGPLQLDIGFKPPNGVGLSLDAGGFKGGGFLMFDFDKGEYAGALELDFKGMFSVKAIGIINTKMPDGSKGFSLLIIIAAEFTPIQLSFGFTLNGVGGIIGLNRSINVSALVDGIRTNAIKSILFPEDVVANITRIISDIKQFFPVQQDHFVVGPMAKLGWGTPSLITVELGLLLDLPNPMIAIVGVLKAVIPAEEAPILRLQVNFIGILDFEHGYVFFRADLFDSRLLLFSLTGSMAFLVSWGEQKTFALSVGGFHPDFRDIPSIPALPNGFHNMARLGISLLSDDNPRLKVESYFAITSNTVQFGAKVELYAEAMGFNVYGFLGYDVLFQFEPFRFIAKLYAGIALRSGTSVIAGISISAQLSGPTPWDAQGSASLELFWFLTISVGFHVTWGDPPPAVEPATEDLLALLQREMNDTRNWRAEIPANNHLHVSLRQIEPPAGSELLVIHPSGILTFSQRSLPLEDYLIQKFGTKKPLNANKFKLTNAQSGSTNIPADFANVREPFAPANFTELDDSEKLSRKSFEALPSGFRLSGTSDLHVGTPVPRPVVYELSYLRRRRIEFKRLIDLALVTYNRLVKSSAVRQSALAYQQVRVSLNAPAQVVLPEESFAIANTSDLKSHGSDGQLFATQAEAYQRQQELLLQNPALAGQIQVVSNFELNQN